jgi:hypothetical protein
MSVALPVLGSAIAVGLPAKAKLAVKAVADTARKAVIRCDIFDSLRLMEMKRGERISVTG